MKLHFAGLMRSLDLAPGSVSVLEVHNRTLFARLCQSLLSGKGDQAIEPFSLWDEGVEVKPERALLLSPDLFNLPWDDRRLASGALASIESMVLENERVRSEIESLASRLSSQIASLCWQLEGDYRLGIEWELRRYLKSFGFGADRDADAPLIDNLIKYLDYVADIEVSLTIVFVNLKLFLGEKDLDRLYERVFFLKNTVLDLEAVPGSVSRDNEIKLCVDQDFLEF